MREIRLSGSEGGGTEFNRFSLPLSNVVPGLSPACVDLKVGATTVVQRRKPRLSKVANSPLAPAFRNFGVRELAPAFSAADLSAVGKSPRPVAVTDRRIELRRGKAATSRRTVRLM
jgi:hypothetical protein